MVGYELDTLLTRYASSDDKNLKEIIEGIIERAKGKISFSSYCMSSSAMNVNTIKISGKCSYEHSTPLKLLLLSQYICTITLNEAGDASRTC